MYTAEHLYRSEIADIIRGQFSNTNPNPQDHRDMKETVYRAPDLPRGWASKATRLQHL